MEYLAIDQNFLIVAQSIAVADFAQLPQACQVGADIRQAFPELIGLESIIQEIIAQQQTYFTLTDINRTESEKSVYFDLSILSMPIGCGRSAAENPDPSPGQTQSESCLILIQEKTERNSLVQQYTQIINRLSLEIEQVNLQKNYYKFLFNQIDSVNLIKTNKAGKIIQANRVAIKTFGFTATELNNKYISELWLYSPFKNYKIEQLCDRNNVEIICQTKTKKIRYINFSCLTINSHKPLELIWIGKDITRSKQYEIQLLKYAKREKIFNQIVHQLYQFQPLQATLKAVSELIRKYLKCDRYIIYQPQSPHAGILAQAQAPHLEPLQQAQILQMLSLQPELQPNYQVGEPCSYYNQSQNQSVLALTIQTPPWNKLAVAVNASPRQWQPTEIQFLQQINGQVAGAIAIAQLQQWSIVDDSTKITNRRAFEQRLAQEWQRAVRHKTNLALIMCQIDYFQVYQKNYGVNASNSCLKSIAAMLKTNARRPADLVARYDDDKFVLLLPQTDLDGAVIVAQRLQQCLKTLSLPHHYSPIADNLTLSLGVASQIPDLNSEYTQLVETADAALEQAKINGRNRISQLQRSELGS